MYAGQIGSRQTFTYNGQSYTLWVAKDRLGVKVKVAQGSNLIKVLAASDFDITVSPNARTDLQAVVSAASAVSSAGTASAMSSATPAVATALNTLVNDILANACVALNAGCFAAGTMLWTPYGYRAVETIRPGEGIYSRSEWDPSGPVEEKMVEATFTRSAPILHLHVRAEDAGEERSDVIRTTGEHPFFAYDKGWTKASALQVGDRLLTDAGDWVVVDDLLDTGEWEPVYNLRVADHHTYFVGDYRWGFAVWAHNAYIGYRQNSAAQNAIAQFRASDGKPVFNQTATATGTCAVIKVGSNQNVFATQGNNGAWGQASYALSNRQAGFRNCRMPVYSRPTRPSANTKV